MWLSGDLMHCGAPCRSRGVRGLAVRCRMRSDGEAGFAEPFLVKKPLQAAQPGAAPSLSATGCQAAAVQSNGSSQSEHLGKFRSFLQKARQMPRCSSH